MRLHLSTLALATALLVAACDGDPGLMGSAGPAGPAGGVGGAGPAGPPGPPASVDLAALVRSAMSEPEYSVPRELNEINVVNTENPGEFDDWVQ